MKVVKYLKFFKKFFEVYVVIVYIGIRINRFVWYDYGSVVSNYVIYG